MRSVACVFFLFMLLLEEIKVRLRRGCEGREAFGRVGCFVILMQSEPTLSILMHSKRTFKQSNAFCSLCFFMFMLLLEE